MTDWGDVLGDLSENLVGSGVPWRSLPGGDAERAREAFRAASAATDRRDQAMLARDRALEGIGSHGVVFAGVTKVGEAMRSVVAALTDGGIVLFDADVAANPAGELAQIARGAIDGVRILDEWGSDVSHAVLDPVRELETPEEEKYSVVLDRDAAAGGPVSFLFLSGEPATTMRDRVAAYLGDGPRA